MYAWEEGREDLFCNNLVHLCMRKGQESALISISANLKPLHQLYQCLSTQYKMTHHAHARTAASEERHPALTTAFSSSATLKVSVTYIKPYTPGYLMPFLTPRLAPVVELLSPSPR